jgi:hypothetical protein
LTAEEIEANRANAIKYIEEAQHYNQN